MKDFSNLIAVIQYLCLAIQIYFLVRTIIQNKKQQRQMDKEMREFTTWLEGMKSEVRKMHREMHERVQHFRQNLN